MIGLARDESMFFPFTGLNLFQIHFAELLTGFRIEG